MSPSTPWGGLILCEDGPDDQPQYLRGVTPQGQLYTLAANSYSEFAGACFSPDGSTLFVNAQIARHHLRGDRAVAQVSSRPLPA